MKQGDKVIHNVHGAGIVQSVNGNEVTVNFPTCRLTVNISELQKPLFS
ncbi:gp130 [Sphingomonas phage PAU]|nr:gp130 [Sphingomonas phage PAU]AFF28128.1 gp130 [Sphingomonas phage PAU]